ncbi:MAG: leucyl/phenylalanyl-tRNA--protein transferase [Planctomycetia bacterium]|nr:leucyl/phenylalanyl-tRNA--protein transferase [Planctomycetia bacterium]
MSWLTQAVSSLAALFGRPATRLPVRLNHDQPFPDPHFADDDGLVAVGGDLSVPRLLAAYSSGIFPWYDEGLPILWWSPGSRAIFDLATFTSPKRLARTARQRGFETRFDTSFAAVMRGCAERDEGTWITRDILQGYQHLHRAGFAHCAETWQDGELVGGVYGVSIGGLFAGESMFTRVSDAGKYALCALIERLRERGYVLFDSQILNPHTASLGAIEISRDDYLGRVRKAIQLPVTFGEQPNVR